MSDDVVIRARGVGKRYRIGAKREPYGALRDALADGARRLLGRGDAKPASSEELWALRDVSFEVKRGEVLGVIGRNGAGKSTLLKVLSRITAPTTGEVEIRGRVGSLLEVGTGFHPELTGRENIFVNGSLLGMTRAEIRAKFDEIVEFSGVEKFLDTPVKRYSSGMQVRLAFAVAAHLEPEILLVDEVLAVGDAEFQKKCLGKMGDVAKSGRTILFVSHNMGAVHALCHNIVLLDHGAIAFGGDVASGVDRYLSEGRTHLSNKNFSMFRRNSGTAAVSIESVTAANPRSQAVPGDLAVISTGGDVVINIVLHARQEIRGANLTINLYRANGELITTVFSGDVPFDVNLNKGLNRCVITIESVPFTVGDYVADVGVNQSTVSGAYDVLQSVPLFSINHTPQTRGQYPNRPWGHIYLEKVRWELQGIDAV